MIPIYCAAILPKKFVHFSTYTSNTYTILYLKLTVKHTAALKRAIGTMCVNKNVKE